MDYSHLRTGFFKAKIIALNPSYEKLTEILGEEPDKEPKYFWEKGGVKKAAFDFYLESLQNEVFKYSMLLSNENVVSSKGSYQYINCLGDTQWAILEQQLWDSFVEFQKVTKWNTTSGNYEKGAKPLKKENLGSKYYRIAKKGEEDLVSIYKTINPPNPYDISSNILFDLDKFFEGDFSQIKLDTDTYHLIAFAYVNLEFKQKIWKRFLPLGMYSDLRSKNFGTENRKIYNSWEAQAKEEMFGIQGYYELGMIQTFKEEFIKSNKVISDDGPDY